MVYLLWLLKYTLDYDRCIEGHCSTLLQCTGGSGPSLSALCPEGPFLSRLAHITVLPEEMEGAGDMGH